MVFGLVGRGAPPWAIRGSWPAPRPHEFFFVQTAFNIAMLPRLREENTLGENTMIKLIAAAGFLVAFATSAHAITPAPIPQPDGMLSQVRLGCGPFRTRVAGICVARTTIRHTRRLDRRAYRRGYSSSSRSTVQPTVLLIGGFAALSQPQGANPLWMNLAPLRRGFFVRACRSRRMPDLATIVLVGRSGGAATTRGCFDHQPHEGAVLREKRSQDPKQSTA